MKYEYNKFLKTDKDGQNMGFQKIPDRLSDLTLDKIFHPAETHYVSSTGNDDNDGSIGSPWLTVQHALDHIQEDPILTGNHVIQLLSNITEDFTVPSIMLNGYSLTIKGALTAVDSSIASTNVNPVFTTPGGSYGTLTRTAGAWVANARQYMLAYDGTDYYSIQSNDATILYHANSQQAAGAKTIDVYDWSYTITGVITVAEHMTFNLEDIKVTDSTSGNVEGATLIIGEYSKVVTNRCYIEKTGTVSPVVFLRGFSKIQFEYTILKSVNQGLRIDKTSQIASVRKASGIVLTDATANAKTGLSPTLNSSGEMRNVWIYSSAAKTGSGSIGLNVINGSVIFCIVCIIDNWDTGLKATFGGIASTNSQIYFNACTTDKNPSGATDPAYIL